MLGEHAEFVADAVAEAGNVQRRHAVDQTGRQPAQTAIAQGGFDLPAAQQVEIVAQIGDGLPERVIESQIDHAVGQRPSDQEFHR